MEFNRTRDWPAIFSLKLVVNFNRPMQWFNKAIPVLALALLLQGLRGNCQAPPINIKANDCNCPSMVKKGNKSLYFSYGFHRVFFTNSTIHLKDHSTDDYDFNIIKARAHD